MEDKLPMAEVTKTPKAMPKFGPALLAYSRTEKPGKNIFFPGFSHCPGKNRFFPGKMRTLAMDLLSSGKNFADMLNASSDHNKK